MPQSHKIGRKVEEFLKQFLNELVFEIDDPPRIISDDLRLMSSGEQHGLDLNWEIRFNQGAIQYKWFFEAKGKGYSKYLDKKTWRHETYKLSIISDKLLQALSYYGLDIDCWCLFAPYLKLDEADKKELSKIQEFLPFKLVVWDKDFLFHRLRSINVDLFKVIYPKEAVSRRVPGEFTKIKTINSIRDLSIFGRFWNALHRRYWVIRNDIKQKCKTKIIFQCEFQESRDQETDARIHTKQFYFLYLRDKYFIDKAYLDQATQEEVTKTITVSGDEVIDNRRLEEANREAIRLVFVNSIKENTQETLSENIQDLLDGDDIPFMQVEIKHKISDYAETIPFELLNSSTYFGCSEDKPIYFGSVKDYT